MNLQNGANIEVIYEAECDFLNEFQPHIKPPPLEEFLRHYADAPGIRFMADDLCIGGMVVKDRLVHIGVLRAHHGAWARLWPDAYRWVFTVSDPVYSLVSPGNAKALMLNRRTGGKFIRKVIVPPMGEMALYEFRNSTTPYPKQARERRLQREQASSSPEQNLQSDSVSAELAS